ncbi:MAG: hypothetical protein JZD41_02155 [Thermoproteus sp.]|nr:hypothetical protein [Thermoproteus sp.]
MILRLLLASKKCIAPEDLLQVEGVYVMLNAPHEAKHFAQIATIMLDNTNVLIADDDRCYKYALVVTKNPKAIFVFRRKFSVSDLDSTVKILDILPASTA